MTKRRKYSPEFKDQVVLETISGAMTQVGFGFKVIDMVHAGADLAIQIDAPECHLDLVTAVPVEFGLSRS
jgi:hypothetical protein